MTETPDPLGHLDDAAEAAAESSTVDGPAAQGEYDPAQGSPQGTPHPTGETYPDEPGKAEGVSPVE